MVRICNYIQHRNKPYKLNKMDFKSINKDLPDKGIQVLCYNEKWIDEEVNPEGVRIGFLCDIRGWVTAQYSHSQDTKPYKSSVPEYWSPCPGKGRDKSSF